MESTSLPGIRAEALEVVNRLLADNPGLPAEALCGIVSDLRGFISDLRDVLAVVESDAVAAMGNRREVTVGRVLYSRHRTSKVTWDDGALAHRMKDTAELLECAKVSYWRLGELKKRQIDPDQFRTSEYGRWSLKESIVTDDDHGLRPDGGEAVDPHEGRAD